MIAITLERATKPGTFWPTLDGVKLTKATRQPFYDGARALIALGHDPATPLHASHQGSDIVAMRSTVGEAAKWRVEESDRGGLRKRIWLPLGNAHSSRQGDVKNGLGALALGILLAMPAMAYDDPASRGRAPGGGPAGDGSAAQGTGHGTTPGQRPPGSYPSHEAQRGLDRGGYNGTGGTPGGMIGHI